MKNYVSMLIITHWTNW